MEYAIEGTLTTAKSGSALDSYSEVVLTTDVISHGAKSQRSRLSVVILATRRLADR